MPTEFTGQAPEYLRAAAEYEERYGKAEARQATARENAQCAFDSAVKAGYDIDMPLNGPTIRQWKLSGLLVDASGDTSKTLLSACHAAVNLHDAAAAEFLRMFVAIQGGAYSDDHWECWL
jgi:hypothetical protein